MNLAALANQQRPSSCSSTRSIFQRIALTARGARWQEPHSGGQQRRLNERKKIFLSSRFVFWCGFRCRHSSSLLALDSSRLRLHPLFLPSLFFLSFYFFLFSFLFSLSLCVGLHHSLWLLEDGDASGRGAHLRKGWQRSTRR